MKKKKKKERQTFNRWKIWIHSPKWPSVYAWGGRWLSLEECVSEFISIIGELKNGSFNPYEYGVLDPLEDKVEVECIEDAAYPVSFGFCTFYDRNACSPVKTHCSYPFFFMRLKQGTNEDLLRFVEFFSLKNSTGRYNDWWAKWENKKGEDEKRIEDEDGLISGGF